MRDIGFEIASVLISAVVLLSLRKSSKIHLMQSSTFMVLVMCNMGTSTISVIYSAARSLNGGVTSALAGYVENTVCFSLQALIMPLLLSYMMCMIREWTEYSPPTRMLVIIPATVNIAMLLITPFTGFLFRVNDKGEFYGTKFTMLIYAFVFYYTLFLLIHMVIFRRRYSAELKFALYYSIATAAIALTLQVAVFIDIAIQPCITAVNTLFFFFISQGSGAFFDERSGAYNSSAFKKAMHAKFVAGKDFELVAVQLEDLPTVERAFGVRIAGGFIKEIAQYLKKTNSKNTVFLLRKSLFVVLMADNAETNSTAKAVIERFDEAWGFEGSNTLFTARVCKMHAPKNAANYDDLDELLDFFAERTEGERIEDATEWNIAEIRRDKIISEGLKRAVEAGKINIYLKPFYSVKEGRISYVEVTSGFMCEGVGLVREFEYMPIAEELEMVDRVCDIIYAKTFEFVSKNGIPDCRFALKMTAEHCSVEGYVDEIRARARSYGCDGSMVSVVTSEYNISKAPDKVKAALDNLNSAGVRLCLNEYGSGYTNISYIYNYPFDTIQVSRTIVASARESRKAEVTLESTFALIKALNMNTASDAANDEVTFRMLMKMSCDFIGGAYISIPLDEEDFLGFMNSFAPLSMGGEPG